MKIAKQSVELIGLMFPVSYNDFTGEWDSDIDGQDPERLIERAGRTCYKSEDKICQDSQKVFIKKIAELGHESVIEHSSASFRIITDRGVSHEMVRHRLVSYSQESTRYCSYGKEKFGGEITVIEPPFEQDKYRDACVREWWVDSVSIAEKAYLDMTKCGVPPQLARSVLPTCLKTELVMTCNFRELLHIFSLRLSPRAHPQMREVAHMIWSIMRKVAPTVFDLEKFRTLAKDAPSGE